jgi:predicted ATP-dependent endonuclease of OLD family
MHITSLTLRNFRNFRAAKLLFKDGINTIIGENGSGKTNLFYALRLLLDDSLPRYVAFNVTDFNRGIGNWAGHWIAITVEFENLADTEEAQALAMQAQVPTSQIPARVLPIRRQEQRRP